MNIKQTTVKKLVVTGIHDLDPVNVFVEEYTSTSGKITIECFGNAWSYFWGSIGERSIMEFFCNCDNHYLSEKFAPQLRSEIDDHDKLPEYARNYIIEMRKEGTFDKKKARALFNQTEYLTMDDSSMMFEIFGDEWWYCCPKIPNYQYLYLSKILDVAKEAVKTLIVDKERQGV